MTKEEFVKIVLTGRPVILVEYRSANPDTIRRKVVKAGESAEMPLIKHKVLVGDDSWEVAEFLDDGKSLKDYKVQFVSRDIVAFELESMEKSKWGNRMSGTFLGKMEGVK